MLSLSAPNREEAVWEHSEKAAGHPDFRFSASRNVVKPPGLWYFVMKALAH